MVFSNANYEKAFPRKDPEPAKMDPKPEKLERPEPAPVGSVTEEAERLEEPEGGECDGAE